MQTTCCFSWSSINHSKSNALLTEFVTHHQIPVVTTLLGLGAIPYENPLFLGMGGMHGSYASNMALTECDLLINLGSRFDDRLASNPKEFVPNAKWYTLILMNQKLIK